MKVKTKVEIEIESELDTERQVQFINDWIAPRLHYIIPEGINAKIIKYHINGNIVK